MRFPTIVDKMVAEQPCIVAMRPMTRWLLNNRAQGHARTMWVLHTRGTWCRSCDSEVCLATSRLESMKDGNEYTAAAISGPRDTEYPQLVRKTSDSYPEA